MRRYNPKTEYEEDVTRIVKVAHDHGWDLSSADAAYLWEKLSGEACAQWLYPPESDDSLWYILNGELSHMSQ